MQPRRITRRSAIAAGVATAIMPIRALAARQSAHAYRAIRYARAERFSPAVLEPFRESLIQKERGPIAPQLPGGLSISIGPQSPNRQQRHGDEKRGKSLRTCDPHVPARTAVRLCKSSQGHVGDGIRRGGKQTQHQGSKRDRGFVTGIQCDRIALSGRITGRWSRCRRSVRIRRASGHEGRSSYAEREGVNDREAGSELGES